MNKTMKKLAIAVAAVMVSGFGLQACSSDDAIAYLLGEVDGPTAMELASLVAGNCNPNCDGTIEELGVMGADVKGPPPPEGDIDDDLDSLLESLYEMTDANPSISEIENAFNMEVEDAFPEGLDPEETVNFGPLGGYASLDEACNAGNGVIAKTLRYTLYGGDVMMAGEKGFAPDLQVVGEHSQAALTLFGCEITGSLAGGGSEMVTLSGSLIGTEDWDQDTGWRYTMQGTVYVNPGAVEPAGDPTLIWGYNVPVRFDMEVGENFVKGLDVSEGGACYGGTTVTEAGCEGIFVDAAYLNNLFD